MLKNKRLLLSSVNLLFLSCIVFAQQETAVPILNIPASPFLNGMAAVGTALPTSDEFGFSYNPAQLAYTTRITPFAAHFYPVNIEISNHSKPTLKGSAFNLGFMIGGRNRMIPINLALGYMSFELDLGEIVYSDTTGNELDRILSNEYYNAFAIAMGLRYWVEFYAGLNYKYVTSQPGYAILPGNQLVRARERFGAWDYGFLVLIPIIRDREMMRRPGDRIRLKYQPFVNLSFGYSKSNIGKEVTYSDILLPKPLPRTAKLGYGLTIGFDLLIKRALIRLVQVDWSVQANDLLSYNTSGSSTKLNISDIDYQAFLGDINVYRNIISARGDNKVESRLGFSIELGEVFRYSQGYFEGRGWERKTTRGFAIRTKGIFKLLRRKYTRSWYSFIVDNLDIRYFTSTYYVNHDHMSRFHGISLQMNRF
jgi:hypothetical protein